MENTLKNIILLVVLSFAFSCQSFTKFFDRSPSSEEKAKHYVVTVHGLGGNATTFGSLLPVLKMHLEMVNKNYDVVPVTLTYATGQSGHVTQFIEEFEKQIEEYFSKNSLGVHDKISIIAHSQGGLVTTFWYSSATELPIKNPRQAEVADHVVNIVTEGTPFWGSKTAHVINDVLPFEWMRNFVFSVMPVGKNEINDMSTGSTKIFNFFRKKSSETVVNIKSPYMLNIAGINPRADKFSGPFWNVGERWESDQAVNVPSARLGFLYYSDSIFEYVNQTKKQNIEFADFQYSQYFSRNPQFLLVEETHTKSYKDYYGMPLVPEKCKNPNTCDQVTYPAVFVHVSGCELSGNNCDQQVYQDLRNALYKNDPSLGLTKHKELAKQMRTFQLAFNIKLPKGFVVPQDLLQSREGITKYVRVNYVKGNAERTNSKADRHEDALLVREYPFQDFRIQLGRYQEMGSRVAKHHQDSDELNIQFAGNVKPTDAYWKLEKEAPLNWNEKTFPVTVTIDIPGLESRTITLPVKPTLTTFVELKLNSK